MLENQTPIFLSLSTPNLYIDEPITKELTKFSYFHTGALKLWIKTFPSRAEKIKTKGDLFFKWKGKSEQRDSIGWFTYLPQLGSTWTLLSMKQTSVDSSRCNKGLLAQQGVEDRSPFPSSQRKSNVWELCLSEI